MHALHLAQRRRLQQLGATAGQQAELPRRELTQIANGGSVAGRRRDTIRLEEGHRQTPCLAVERAVSGGEPSATLVLGHLRRRGGQAERLEDSRSRVVAVRQTGRRRHYFSSQGKPRFEYWKCVSGV
jgi:hypothetical protein